MAVLFCHGPMEGDCRPGLYIFRGMLMGWRLCRDIGKWERGTLGCWDSERERPMRAPSLCTDMWWAALGKQIRIAQTGPEGRTRRDEWNSRETDFSLTQGRRLTQLELSCPSVDLAALEAMNPKGVYQRKIKGALAPQPRGIFTDAVIFTLLYFLHCTCHRGWPCLSVDLPTVSIPGPYPPCSLLCPKNTEWCLSHGRWLTNTGTMSEGRLRERFNRRLKGKSWNWISKLKNIYTRLSWMKPHEGLKSIKQLNVVF